MVVIIVTGTPGTGKTEVAKMLAHGLGFAYIDVNDIIEKNKLCEEYDEIKKCAVIDVEKLNEALIKIVKTGGDYIIDSHMAQHMPKKYVTLCVVTKCELKTLKERLEERGYSEEKVRENLDAEIFDNCLVEAEEEGHKLMIVDTTNGVEEEKVVREIKEKLK